MRRLWLRCQTSNNSVDSVVVANANVSVASSSLGFLLMQRKSSSSLPSTASHRRTSFRPFSAEDEEQLVSVLTTKPRHVARHIRQSVQHSRKQAVQFRNAITFLMIQLQQKLQREEISAVDAADIMESVMRECVALRQSDLAHLLFRASLRFRKYGLRVTHNFVKILFDNYKAGGARTLMLNLAEELKEDPGLVNITMTAYVLGGKTDVGDAMLEHISPLERRTEDIVALLEAYGMVGQLHKVDEYFRKYLQLAKDKQTPQVNFVQVASTSLVCLRGNSDLLLSAYQAVLANTSLTLPLSDAAVGAVFRHSCMNFHSLAEVYELETTMKAALQVESLGLGAETALISRCSELIARGQAVGDEIMLVKVNHLRAIVEANVNAVVGGDTASASSSNSSSSSSPVSEIDQQYIFSLIKGFGILGKLDDMRSAFNLLESNGIIQDHRVYDEMLRWYAFSNNLKEVIALKEKMTAQDVYHTAHTYQYVFRTLDKHYPRMVEKYFTEMRERRIMLDGPLYVSLVRVFAELGDFKQVHELHDDIKHRMQQYGQHYLMSPTLMVQLLRAYQAENDLVKCERVIADAAQYGYLTIDWVQAEMIQYYSAHGRHDEVVRLVENLPSKSGNVYRVLLRDAARRGDRKRFDALWGELRSSGIRLTDRLFSTLVAALGHFNDAEGIKKVVMQARDSDTIRHGQFFADAAASFAKVHDWQSVEDCWERLQSSKLPIGMTIFNRFLDLFMQHGNLDKVQHILGVMMKSVPPNPITATTVVDMLGKMGKLSEMEALLDEMELSANAHPTLVTYHQAMNAYAKAGDIQKIEAVRQKLLSRGLHENHVTYNILVEGYGRAKRVEHIKELVAERRAKNIPMEPFGYVILMGIYAREKMVEEVKELIRDMTHNPAVTMSNRLWCAIASASASIHDLGTVETCVQEILKHPQRVDRDVETVFYLFARLRDVRRLQQLLDDPAIPKTQPTLNVCISSFAKAGEHAKVAVLLHQMEQNNMTLSRNTAVTLSSLLLKAGKLQLAQAVLQMNTRPNNSSKKHKEYTAAASPPPVVDVERPADGVTPADPLTPSEEEAEAKVLDAHVEELRLESLREGNSVGKENSSSEELL